MEALRAIGTLSEEPAPPHAAIAAALGLDTPSPAQWHATFVQTFYPYASVYLGERGFLGGEVRAAAAGVFSVIGATVPTEADHLAVLLNGMAHAQERRWLPVSSTLLWEHLLPWTLPYLDRVAGDGHGPFRAWAALLDDLLLQIAEETPRPPSLALTVVDPPTTLPDPRCTTDDDLVAAALAPARLGAIVTRDDLLAAADDLALAPRMGERRYVLRALLQQDPTGTLAWLADHCVDAAAAHRRRPSHVRHISDWWAGRATRSADLLGELAIAAAAMNHPAGSN